jgi:hypothetical protein
MNTAINKVNYYTFWSDIAILCSMNKHLEPATRCITNLTLYSARTMDLPNLPNPS